MSLSRFELRDAYGMNQTDFYRKVDREDPNAILNGVAVSGLVGILRQLGDLAEFAAEVFQGLQEEVMSTASRSKQLKIRLKHIETTIFPLEKSMFAQTNHIHFAYTGGVEWHPRIPFEQNQLIYNDLPRFIMDPYEDCRDPPQLHLLDKFDINGPGSCFKRYSDSTYFRRASSNVIKGNKKFQKDKMNSKVKKKKYSPRSRDMSRLASMANQSARKTCTSFSLSGQTSSPKSASTSDMEKSSDLQDHHSLSVDSRSDSGYIECLSTATYSLKTGERPKGASVLSNLPLVSITSALSECETGDAHDNFQLRPSKGLAARGSSCVSWDEKAEIVESLGQQSDEASEMMETNSAVDALDGKAIYGKETCKVDFQAKNIEKTKSEPGLPKCIEIDDLKETRTGVEIAREPKDSECETESEGDCFVDALNTIELDSETDQGAQTSQEALRSSCGVTDERLEKSVRGQELEQNSNSVKDSSRSMDGLMDYGFGKNEKYYSIVERLSSAHAFDEINHQNPHMSLDIRRSPRNDVCTDNITLTFVPAPENSLPDSSDPLYHCDLQKQQKTEAEISSKVDAIKIWTNGGLLGLKPSKPPVLAVPSSSSQNCRAGERTVDSAETEKDKPDDVVQNASSLHVLNNSRSASPGIQTSVSSDGKGTQFIGQGACHESSSGASGLNHKFLTNVFRRKDSSFDDRKTVPATIPEKDEVMAVKSLMDPFEDEAPIEWFTSSPPLQHMKISLNPVDTLQPSRLKLKFSDGDNNYDTFYSFQLLPETAASIPDSYSDDDTFCRSSTCMSDTDYLSDNHSLSNSEQWEESSDSHERKNLELCDSSLQVESESDSVAINLSYLQIPAEPLPPPFPPLQWMASKTPSEKAEDKAQSLQLQDALKFALEKHISLSSVNRKLPNVVTSAPKPEIKVHLKNNARESKQSANAKETETEDFLQQIRNQQNNLRPVVITTTLSATPTTTPTINTKISAILEKANSICQAAASEDGDESDSWSDM